MSGPRSKSIRMSLALLSLVTVAFIVGLVLPHSAGSQSGSAGSQSGARQAVRDQGSSTRSPLAAGARDLELATRAPEAVATAGLPADCIPKSSGPPGAPYQLGLVGSVTNGVLMAGPAKVADITAKFCGVVTVVAGTPPCGATGSASSPSDGQMFGALSAELTLVPGMTPRIPFVAHPGTIKGGFACASSKNGLAVDLTATVSGSTGLYGLSCTIGPLSIPLTGVLTGPLNDASITLTSHDFSVPGVTSSPTCGGEVPASLDAIAGLPIPSGKASITLPATASLYQP